MRRLALRLVYGFLVGALIASFADAANQLVISYASFNERTAGALLVAEDHGFFRKQGLDVRLVYVRTGSVALSALAAGESQFYFGSGTGATLGAIAGGLDGVFVAGLVSPSGMVETPRLQAKRRVVTPAQAGVQA